MSRSRMHYGVSLLLHGAMFDVILEGDPINQDYKTLLPSEELNAEVVSTSFYDRASPGRLNPSTSDECWTRKQAGQEILFGLVK